jgi:iron-sulfur cluster assembly protein
MNQIEVTPNASKHIVSMITRDNKRNLLLEIVPGGCNGFEYKWTPVDDFENDGGIEIRLSENNVLYLNKFTADKMTGSIIAIETLGLNKKLNIINPNVSYSCGCGESVTF